MDNVFARLEDLSAKLNLTSDSISQTLTRVESRLAKLRLGVEVWLDEPLSRDPLRDKNGKAMETVDTYLGYAKVNGTWHIARRNNEGDILAGNPDANRTWAIQQAPRDERVAALKRIPELIKAIEAKAEAQLHEVMLALDSVSVLTAENVNLDVDS
jgi:hypothetical protein